MPIHGKPNGAGWSSSHDDHELLVFCFNGIPRAHTWQTHWSWVELVTGAGRLMMIMNCWYWYSIFLYLHLAHCVSSVSLEGVSHIATGGDNVFASEGPNIYRYSTDLEQQQTLVLDDSIDVLGLATTPDGEWLIACIANDNCFVRNGSDISTGTRTVDNAVGESNRVALFTAGPIPGGQSFYAGSYGTVMNGVGERIRFGQYGFAGSNIDRSSVGSVSSFNGRNYYGGFSLPDYAYFVVIDEDGATPQLRIIRVCSSGSLVSQYELQLQCASTLLGTAIVRGLSLINQETLVIGLTVTGGFGNRLCTFNMSDINSRMDAVYSSCVVVMSSDSRNLVWSGLNCNSPGIDSDPSIVSYSFFDIHLGNYYISF